MIIVTSSTLITEKPPYYNHLQEKMRIGYPKKKNVE